MIVFFVFFVIVPDYRAFGNMHILLQNATAQLGVTSDITVVEYDAPIDIRSGVNVDVPTQDGISHLAP
jgi:hypothetical protein